MVDRKWLASVILFGLLLGACSSSSSSTRSSTAATGGNTPPSSQPRTTNGASTTTTLPGVVPSIATMSYAKTFSSPYFSVDISYPHLSGMTPGGVESAVNSSISKAVSGFVSQFASVLKEQSRDLQGGSGYPSQISGSFTTTFVSSRYASFRFLLDSYNIQAASPTQRAESLTYDLSNAQSISLQDLFSTPDYLQTLSALSAVQLRKKLGDTAQQNLISGGTQPYPKNFSAWNITQSSLEITFAQGQVAPVASGAVSIEIPYSELAGIAMHPGPLSQG